MFILVRDFYFYLDNQLPISSRISVAAFANID